MSKNNKILITILVIVIAIFAFTKLDNKTEKKINFFDVDSILIKKIEIKNGDEQIVLQKENSVWKMILPKVSELEDKAIARLFESGLNVTASSLPVSESASSHEIYNVSDSSGTQVKCYDEDNAIISSVILGKSSQWNNTPGRKADKDAVYRLDSNINTVFSTSADKWRKKELLFFFQENIKKLEVIYPPQKYSITRTDSLWKVELDAKTLYVEESNDFLQTIFGNLNNVKVAKFYDGDYAKVEELFNSPDMIINIEEMSGKNSTLTMVSDEMKKYRLLKINDDISQLYYVSDFWYDKFLKRADFQ